MSKNVQEFELSLPDDIRDDFLRQCGYYDEETPGFIGHKKFANLCATWGANHEYQESHNFIDETWGSDHACDYQESRRPKVKTERQIAMEALDYIDEMAISSKRGYEYYETLKEQRNLLYKFIESLPEEDT